MTARKRPSRALPGAGSIYRHVTKRRDGTERVRWRWVFEGRVRTFLTREAALSAQKRMLDERAAGVRSDDTLTLVAHLDRWLREVKAVEGVAPTTLKLYRGLVDGHIAKHFGSARLSDLTTSQIQTYLAKLVTLDDFAPATVQVHRYLLSGALEYARKARLIAYNPARDTVAPRVRKPKKIAPTVADATALLARFPDPPWQGVVTLGLCYGLRISEILGLRWRDCGESTITVTGQLGVNGHGWREQRKVEGDLVLALVEPVERALSRQKAYQAAQRLKAGPAWADTHGLIFTRDDGRPLTQEMAYRAFQRGVQGSGLPFKTPHDLRHANNSLADELGVDQGTRMEVLGHRNVETNRLYTHTNTERARAGLERIARAIGG